MDRMPEIAITSSQSEVFMRTCTLLSPEEISSLPPVLGPSEVATLLLCSPRTVYRLHHAGKLPACVGTVRLLWKKDDILAMLAATRRGVNRD